MKRIILVSLCIYSATCGMKAPFNQALKKDILKCIEARDVTKLSELIKTENITLVDKEIAQAAEQEFEAYQNTIQPGQLLFSSPAWDIFIMLTRLEPEESKRLFLNPRLVFQNRGEENK